MTDMQQLPLDALFASPLNPRQTRDPDALETLARSIAERGILENLVARPAGDRFEIIAGERRWRAACSLVEAGLWPAEATVPVLVREADDVAVRELALTENAQRHDLHPLDEAEAYAALRDSGRTIAQIADLVPYTKRHVELRLNLADHLSPDVKTAFREGLIELAQARTLAAYAAPERQPKALANITANNWAYATAERLRATLAEDLVPVKTARFTPDTYDGPIVEDPDDSEQRFFADADQFRRLQEQAIAELHAKLEAKYSWVLIVRGNFRPWEYGRSKDKKIAGAVIEVTQRGDVTVYNDLLRPADARRIEKAKARTRADATTEAQAIDAAALVSPTKEGYLGIVSTAKRDAIAAALVAAGPEPAMVLAIAGMLNAGFVGLSRTTSTADLAPAVAGELGALRERLVADGVPMRPDNPLALDWQDGAIASLIRAILPWPRVEIARLFTALIAATITVERDGLGDPGGVPEIAEALGARVGQTPASSGPDGLVPWRLHEGFLKTCRKPALAVIARGLGLEAAGGRPDKATAASIRAEIAAALAERPAGAEAAYLPIPLRFGYREDLIGQARTEAEAAPAAAKAVRKDHDAGAANAGVCAHIDAMIAEAAPAPKPTSKAKRRAKRVDALEAGPEAFQPPSSAPAGQDSPPSKARKPRPKAKRKAGAKAAARTRAIKRGVKV